MPEGLIAFLKIYSILGVFLGVGYYLLGCMKDIAHGVKEGAPGYNYCNKLLIIVCVLLVIPVANIFVILFPVQMIAVVTEVFNIKVEK